MIDEKKLIERLAASKHFLFHDECGRQTVSIDKIIDLLKNTEKVGEWIPVSERLPEHSERCLVSTGNIVMTCPYCEIKFKEYGVTAWQPLPEPYREEGAE